MKKKMLIPLALLASACSQPTVQTATGSYVYGHEVESFTPCGSESAYWATGSSSVLQPLQNASLQKAQQTGNPYQPVYITAEYTDQGKTSEGFAAEYDSVIKIHKAVPAEGCP